MEKSLYLYLDDIRTPVDKTWIVVRNYDDFVKEIEMHGLKSFKLISLDHDLGPQAIEEFMNNTLKTSEFNYKMVAEKTGLDCAKYLVEKSYENDFEISDFPEVRIHSANPVGSANMMGFINNFLYVHRQPQTCVRWRVEHT